MIDPELEMRRVVFELPNRDIPELMVALGGFVAAHNIAIEFSEAPDATGPSLTLERTPEQAQQYNPDLVTEVVDPETGDTVAIVDECQIDRFEAARNYSTGLPLRTLFSLVRSETAYGGYDSTRGYVYSSDVGNRGLLADKLPELVQKLSSGHMKVYSVGPHGIKFLHDLLEALHQTEATEQ